LTHNGHRNDFNNLSGAAQTVILTELALPGAGSAALCVLAG
jgi:hypothetical protein